MSTTHLNFTPNAQLEVWQWKIAAYNEVAQLPSEAQIPFIHEKVSKIADWIKQQQAINKNRIK